MRRLLAFLAAVLVIASTGFVVAGCSGGTKSDDPEVMDRDAIEEQESQEKEAEGS